MRKTSLLTLLCLTFLGVSCKQLAMNDIPLPEHPRPDFERADWINLNGYWHFSFADDTIATDVKNNTFEHFDKQIKVPFPWGSKLSEVADEGDIAWYGREISIPSSWKGKRIFLVVGASDWETKAWLDGHELGMHQGGYTPFEFELTDKVQFGNTQKIFFRVDDTHSYSHLYGKQGYGNARGFWQTVYLEARGTNYFESIHFSPNIDNKEVQVAVQLANEANDMDLELTFKNADMPRFTTKINGKEATFVIPIENQHLWTLDDPYLYEVSAALKQADKKIDCVNTYFGQRKIGIATLPGTEYKYIALNNKPLYLQLCLDQSYTPDGFYTFPSDEFIQNEIMLSKKLGLNGNRVHIKVEVPRKLYWADKMGLLIMADVPNFWGEPNDSARNDWEHCLRNQVKRDYNHPSIFAWVDFNETWGLFTHNEDNKRIYAEETQEWVRNMYRLNKQLDPTRLVEDNSACNHDHVETDINSWHNYNAGYKWEEQIAMYDKNNFVGSTFNYIGGNSQPDIPLLNSECGNVWGYTHSAGDCDFTWDYHEMMNSFRRHPKICGWLYTEHHDVINEWNGYVQYDRTPKIDGLSDLVPDMAINDFHSPYYISPNMPTCIDAQANSKQTVPLVASFMTDEDPGKLAIHTHLIGWNQLGEKAEYNTPSMDLAFEPYMNRPIGNIEFTLPEAKGLYLLQVVLTNDKGKTLHRNFTTFVVKDGIDAYPHNAKVATFAPCSFSDAQWSQKQLNVLDGLKANGFGNGYFEYTVTLPEDVDPAQFKSAKLVFEASSKQLFMKDIEENEKELLNMNYMLGKSTFDHCRVPNAYAMTDDEPWASAVTVNVNGQDCGTYPLSDDPADHRGILSWHAQPQNKTLSEAGSYGYLIQADVPTTCLAKGQPVKIRLSVPAETANGLAIYGKDFGRYPLDPTLLLQP